MFFKEFYHKAFNPFALMLFGYAKDNAVNGAAIAFQLMVHEFNFAPPVQVSVYIFKEFIQFGNADIKPNRRFIMLSKNCNIRIKNRL